MRVNVEILGAIQHWNFLTGEQEYAIIVAGPGGQETTLNVEPGFFATVVEQFYQTPQGQQALVRQQAALSETAPSTMEAPPAGVDEQGEPTAAAIAQEEEAILRAAQVEAAKAQLVQGPQLTGVAVDEDGFPSS